MRGAPRWIGLTCGLALLIGCVSGPRTTQIRDPLDPAVGHTAARYPDADAVVLSDLGHLTFVDPSRPSAGHVLTTRLRVKVLTPAGRSNGRVQLYLDPWDELLEVAARSYRPGTGGSPLHLPAGAISYTSAAPGAGILYSQARVATFDVPGVEVGDIVETLVRVRSRQVFALPRWFFNGSSPVQRSELLVDVPPGWRLRWAAWEAGAPSKLTPEVTPLPEGQRMRFAQSSLPGLEYTPTERDPDADGWRFRLQLAIEQAPGEAGRDSFATWEDLGAWYRGLVGARDRVGDHAWRRVQRSLGARPTAAQIFAYVRDRVRYVQLYEDSLAGYRPHSAAAVLERGAGDCKDMTTLLIALLHRAGVEAFPALVGVGDRVFFDEGFPAVGAFNHLVAALPRADGTYLYLDATNKAGVFGGQVSHLEGQGALVILPRRVHLHRVPRRGAGVHRVDVVYTMLAADRVQVQAELHGEAAEGWAWWAKNDPERLDARIEGAFLSRLAPRRVVEAKVSTKDEVVTVRATAEVAALTRDTGGLRFVPLVGFVPGPRLDPTPSPRQTRVSLGSPRTLVVTLRVPVGGGVDHLPPKRQLSLPEVTIAAGAEVVGGFVEARTELTVHRSHAPMSRWAALRGVDDLLVRARRGAVVVRGGGR